MPSFTTVSLINPLNYKKSIRTVQKSHNEIFVRFLSALSYNLIIDSLFVISGAAAIRAEIYYKILNAIFIFKKVLT